MSSTVQHVTVMVIQLIHPHGLCVVCWMTRLLPVGLVHFQLSKPSPFSI